MVHWESANRISMISGDGQKLEALIFEDGVKISWNFQFSKRLFDPYFPDRGSTHNDKVIGICDSVSFGIG
ncbi:hypothetical protein SAMN02746041_00953 [Desulfacinum hydrothermale DSM 13146]|uniref:Uncharacterized protein n=1 Tax=Desulfacinum hydrothermale DSM 13146 TaxID=1121390 RepID=A0A1W1XAN1_9BACT|nr:hypothetical protein SAMN02746041_00953 [Desulfacinum hydrothermale DSM 13146]